MTQPKILNLDEMETAESDFTIKYQNVEHKMRVLTVAAFIEQQKRAKLHEKMVEEKEAAGDIDDDDMGEVVKVIRDSVAEFFPTLPVDDMDTTRLFAVFAWLNEMSVKVNEVAAGETTDTELIDDPDALDAEGNVPASEPS